MAAFNDFSEIGGQLVVWNFEVAALRVPIVHQDILKELNVAVFTLEKEAQVFLLSLSKWCTLTCATLSNQDQRSV